MGHDPDELDLVRRFLVDYEAGRVAIPPGNDVAVADGVALARLLVGEDVIETLDDLVRLDAILKSSGVTPPWSTTPQPKLREFERPRTRTSNERRHIRAVSAGRRAAVGWMRSDATRREVEAAGPKLIDAAAPLWVYDQTTLVLVLGRLLDTAAFYPDGAAWPDPLIGATAEFRARFDAVRGPYVAGLRELALRIHAAGAPIDPDDLGVLLVIAQLVHLPIDWSRDAAVIMDELVVWPPGWIDLGAAGQGHLVMHVSRHGRRTQIARDLSEAGEAIVRRVGPKPFAAPYAGGHRRKRPRREHRMEARRRAVTRVLTRFPTATAGEILRSWDDSGATRGGMLRVAMKCQPHDPAPAESTLRADILAAKAAIRNGELER